MVYNLAQNIMKYGDLYLNEGPREKRQKNLRTPELLSGTQKRVTLGEI